MPTRLKTIRSFGIKFRAHGDIAADLIDLCATGNTLRIEVTPDFLTRHWSGNIPGADTAANLLEAKLAGNITDVQVTVGITQLQIADTPDRCGAADLLDLNAAA